MSKKIVSIIDPTKYGLDNIQKLCHSFKEMANYHQINQINICTCRTQIDDGDPRPIQRE